MNMNIIYDITKDEDNYRYCLIDKSYPSYDRENINILPAFALELQTDINSALTTNEKYKVIHSYLLAKYKNQYLLDLLANALSQVWDKLSGDYVKRLLKYFQIDTYNALPVTCYMTTLKMCPYNRQKRYFFVPLYANIADQTRIIMHELMHIIFLDNFQSYLTDRGVSQQGILEINESLTVLLNLEFNDLLLIEETNKKPSTYDLQTIVKNEYQKSTPFKSILDELIANRL